LRGDRGFSYRLREVNRVLPLGSGLIGRVALTGRVRHLDQVAKATDLLPAARAVVLKDGIRACRYVPAIESSARSRGRRNPDPFSDEEVALLESAADQIGLALDNARLYPETLQQLEDLRHAQRKW